MADAVDKTDDPEAVVGDVVSLQTLIEYVDDYLDVSDKARADSEKARDYYDGKQWTEKELETFRKRKQPVITNNRIKPMVDTLKGMEVAGRTDPKAFARTPKHELDADAATDAVRYVQDHNRFDVTSSDVYENMLIEGLGGCDIVWDSTTKQIQLNLYLYDRCIVDPYDRTRHCTNSRYKGHVTWMDLDTIQARWKTNAENVRSSYDEWRTASDQTLDDRPRWFDTQRKRVMVIELYFMHNQKWHRAVFTKGTFLEEPILSPYKDQDGLHTCPIEIASPFIDREGRRYGFVQSKMSMQDAINKRESKATDLLNRRQTFSKKGGIDNKTEFKSQINDAGGHVEFPAGPGEFGKDFGIIPNEELVGPQLQMYTQAVSAFDSITRGGLAPENETNLSGRALRTLQQGRNMEVSPVRDVYHYWLIRVATQIWERIRQFWKEETWIRVTDDESNVRFVGLNRNMTVRDNILMQLGEIPQEIQQQADANPQFAAQLDEDVLDQEGNPIPMNEVSSLDVDIFLEEVPDVLTLQQEVFEMLVELAQARPEIPFQMIVESSPLPARVKRRLLQEPQQTIQQQQQQEAATQTQVAKDQAEIAKTTAEAQDKTAKARQTELENDLLERFTSIGGTPDQVIV